MYIHIYILDDDYQTQIKKHPDWPWEWSQVGGAWVQDLGGRWARAPVGSVNHGLLASNLPN